jgi:hypothetical protein
LTEVIDRFDLPTVHFSKSLESTDVLHTLS